MSRRNKKPRTILGTFCWENIGMIVGKFLVKVMVCVLIICAISFVKKNITYAIETRSIKLEEQKIEEAKQKEKIELEKEKQVEEKEKQRQTEEKRQKEKERINKRFKVGDRIKILDYNWLIQDGDSYRFSVGMIDTVAKVEDGYIYLNCSGEKYYADNECIQKVQSKREWKDLVDLQMKGKLKFHEEIE